MATRQPRRREDPALEEERRRLEEVPPLAAGEPVREPDWREQVTIASGLNVLAGIWLIIAPFVLGYGRGDPIWNDVVFGAAIGLLALTRVAGLYRESWISWINVVFGAWIFASAFWLDASATAGWNDVILGAIVVLLAIWSAGASTPAAYAAAPRDRRTAPRGPRAVPPPVDAPRRREARSPERPKGRSGRVTGV